MTPKKTPAGEIVDVQLSDKERCVLENHELFNADSQEASRFRRHAIKKITVAESISGKWASHPEGFSPLELATLADVAERFGGGTFKLYARNAAGMMMDTAEHTIRAPRRAAPSDDGTPPKPAPSFGDVKLPEGALGALAAFVAPVLLGYLESLRDDRRAERERQQRREETFEAARAADQARSQEQAATLHRIMLEASRTTQESNRQFYEAISAHKASTGSNAGNGLTLDSFAKVLEMGQKMGGGGKASEMDELMQLAQVFFTMQQQGAAPAAQAPHALASVPDPLALDPSAQAAE